MKMICLFVSTVLLGTGAAAAQDSMPDLPYVKTASVTLPSTDTGWDYVKFEPGSARLFMARLDEGLTLFDVDQAAAVATVPDSVGPNRPVLLPPFGRGYVAIDAGPLRVFVLHTLRPHAHPH